MSDSCLELRISREDKSSEENYTESSRQKGRHHHHHHHRDGSHGKHHHRNEKRASDAIDLECNTTNVLRPGQISSYVCESTSINILNDDEVTGTSFKRMNVSESKSNNGFRASTSEERRNPFAIREGNEFMWQNVNMTLHDKKGEREILTDAWGQLHPGEITAIMGISGAGKTSLLHVLAGRCQSNRKMRVEADVRLKRCKVDPTEIDIRKQIAFVAQDDSLIFTATPREAIRFSAKLRLPRVTTDDEINDLTEKMIAELGLESCADTMIGGELMAGISGGERKRTSIGVELVTKPSLVFLDEPTSGLDSFSALQVINVLKKIAQAGCSVLFTIHQPSSEVFNSFDRLILLNQGMVLFQGPVGACQDYFTRHKHPIPKNYNPADWLISVAQKYSREQMLNAEFYIKNDLNLSPDDVPCKSMDNYKLLSLKTSEYGGISDDEWKHVTLNTEIRMLFEREITHNIRNRAGVSIRFALTTFISLLMGSIFFGVGGGNDINSHFGALVMMLMVSMFGTVLPTLISFPDERPVVLREYSTNHYGIVSYFIARLTVEAIITFLQVLEVLLVVYFMVDLQGSFFKLLAIEYALAMSCTAIAVLVGCSVQNPKTAIEFIPVLFIPQILFSGLFVRTELIPVWLRWAQYLCALMYAVRLSLLAEFSDCANNPTIIPNPCKHLLDANMVNENEKALYWSILWGLFVIFRLSGLAVLRKKASKFY